MKFSFSPRLIYVIIILVTGLPLVLGWKMKPARMTSAEKFFSEIESTRADDNSIALVALDYSPSTRAENGSQAELTIEHLLRRRVRLMTLSFVPEAKVFIDTLIPKIIKKLEKESPDQKWEYGVDWVTIGYRPQFILFLKGLSKSDNLKEFIGQDNFGTPLSELKIFRNINTIKDISLLAEFTGSSFLQGYIQFFQGENYTSRIVHGTTAVIVPEAYIYLDSNQIIGLLEGLGGAAWYEKLLSDHYKDRSEDSAMILNTSLGIAQLTVILLVVAGNTFYFLEKRKN